MFFWGQDVLHPSGNLLVANGFQRLPTLGSKGTSRYRREWQGGHIELYGSCAGWYGEGRGFSFIRPMRRCLVWLSSEETPVPGAWRKDLISRPLDRNELYELSAPFLDWMLCYEKEIRARFGEAYRAANYRQYDKVPKARVWIKPENAIQWFRCFRYEPDQLVRPHKLVAVASGPF